MTSARFSLQNSQRKVQFFEETFLLTNTSMEVVVEKYFLAFSNIDVEFIELRKLTWRSYIVAKDLPTTS